MSRIDIFNHVMPSAYLEALKQQSHDPGIIRRMTSLRMLWDIEARVEMLKQWPDLKQVLTLAVPSPRPSWHGWPTKAWPRCAASGRIDFRLSRPRCP